MRDLHAPAYRACARGARASLARPGDGDDRHDGGGLSNPGLSKLATLAPELRHLAKFLPPLWEGGFSIIRSKSAVFGFLGFGQRTPSPADQPGQSRSWNPARVLGVLVAIRSPSASSLR